LATLLRGGTLVEFEPAAVEVSDLRVADGAIVARGPSLPLEPGDEEIDLRGKWILPGLVVGHRHLYTSLAQGMPAPLPPPQGPAEARERGLWRYDAALDLDAVQLAATVGALEALSCGVTTVFDLHSSPRAIEGSLVRVALGVNEVGLRGVLAYETTDRNGALAREEALHENLAFCRKARGRFRGMMGAHASYTLAGDALIGLRQAMEASGAGLHIHLCEDSTDERLSVERFSQGPVTRLMDAGLLGPQTLVADAVQVSWPDLSTLIGTGAWLAHNPRSNMALQAGYAPAGKFGSRALFGSDCLGGDLWAEAQMGRLRACEAEQRIDVLRYLANAQRLASSVFGVPLGRLEPGAGADLVVLDYQPMTPVAVETPDNLVEHLLFAAGSRHVESVMVDGVWRLWARRPLSLNPASLGEHARQVAGALWARMVES
jgi:cytosine/adenosine deaminase-related metal-dependent hydrolase